MRLQHLPDNVQPLKIRIEGRLELGEIIIGRRPRHLDPIHIFDRPAHAHLIVADERRYLFSAARKFTKYILGSLI